MHLHIDFSFKATCSLVLTLIGVLFSSSLFSMNETNGDGDVKREVAVLLEKAIKDKILFYLEDGKKVRSSNLYGFYYKIPRRIDRQDEAIFIRCLKNTVAEYKLVGPNRRPLALIPVSSGHSEESESNAVKNKGHGYSAPRNLNNGYAF